MKDYPALTINELRKCCDLEIEKGNGNKKILISNDDEGNGYHGLFYGFSTDKLEIKSLQDYGLFHDVVDTDCIAILG